MMRAMSRLVLLACLVVGCKDEKPAAKPAPTPEAAKADAAEVAAADAETAKLEPPKQKLEGWELPAEWRSEVIPFPLGFAPTVAHTGYEELRFPKGFFDPASGEYWSYAFVWRTDDAAELDAKALGDEITVYFRGLIDAVDEKKRITARDKIVARAVAATEPNRFTVTAHVFDAFKTAQPIDLSGWAERHACSKGALWIFVLAPAKTTIRAKLDEVARSAKC